MWFGIIDAVGMLLAIVGLQLLVRAHISDDRRLVRLLLVLQAVWLVTVLGVGLTTSFAVAVLAVWCKRVADSMSQPLYGAWQARVIPSEVRATVISAMGQGDAIGQVLGGPVVGVIGNFSLRAALAAASVLHAPVLALLLRLRGSTVNPRRRW